MTLESRLRALADDAFPPTPDLAGRWGASTGRQPAKSARRRRRWVAGAVAALLAIPAAVGAVELWGPENVGLRSVETLPPPPRAGKPTGDRVASLAAAAARAGFAPTVPGFVRAAPSDIRVRRGVVTFRAGRVTVTELEGRLFLGKTLGPGTDAERVVVDGEEGWFISGARHDVVVESAAGTAVLPRRRAGAALVYERDGVVIRVEGLTAPPRSP